MSGQALAQRMGSGSIGLVVGAGLLLAAVTGIVSAVAGAEYGLLILAGVVALVLAVVAPGIPFAMYMLIPLYKGALQPFSPIDLTVLLALVNAAQIVPVVLERRVRHVSITGLLLWAVLAWLVLAGVLYAPDQSIALDHTIGAWALLFIPVAAAGLRVGSDERYLRQVVVTFFGLGLLTVVLGLMMLTDSDRLTVLDTNTIQTARVALIVPVLSMMFVPQMRSSVLKAGALIASALAVVVTLASGSRGPLIALLIIGSIGFLRTVLESQARERRQLVLITAVSIVGVVILVSGAIDLPAVSTDRFRGFGSFIESVVSGEGSVTIEDTSSSARVLLMGFAVELWSQNPLIGAGTAAYPVLSPAALGDFEANAYPHNAFLQIASEHGVVGLMVLGGLAVLALARKLPTRTHGHAIRLLFVFFLLNAMVSGDVFDDRATWALMMLVLLIDVPPPRPRQPGESDDTAWPGTADAVPPPLAWPVPPTVTSPVMPGPYTVPFRTPSVASSHPPAEAVARSAGPRPAGEGHAASTASVSPRGQLPAQTPPSRTVRHPALWVPGGVSQAGARPRPGPSGPRSGGADPEGQRAGPRENLSPDDQPQPHR